MDINDLADFSSTPPQEAAKNIDNASIVDVNPTVYKDNKEHYEPAVEAAKKPTEAEPVVNDNMRKSTEHASLISPNVEHLNFIERQINRFADALFNRPDAQKRIVDLNNKYMWDRANFSKDDEAALTQANADAASIDRKTYGLDGVLQEPPKGLLTRYGKATPGQVDIPPDAVEAAPSWIAGAAFGVGRDLVEGAAEGSRDFAFLGRTMPFAGLGAGMAMYAGVVKHVFNAAAGGMHNELSNMTKPDGSPMNIDDETKRNVSAGVGVLNALIYQTFPHALVKATPFLNTIVTPSTLKDVLFAPEKQVLRIALNNIGQAALAGGVASGSTEMVNVLGEEIGHTYNGEASLTNAIVSAGNNWQEHVPRILKAAAAGGAATGVFAGALNYLGKDAIRAQVDAKAREATNWANNRMDLERDVTPETPKQLNGDGSSKPVPPGAPTPPADSPQPSEHPMTQATKVLQLKTVIDNVNKVAESSEMNDIAPHRLSEIMSQMWQRSGLKYVWGHIEDLRENAKDEKHGQIARDVVDPSGRAAAANNTPFKIPIHDFAEAVRKEPKIMDTMRLGPDEPAVSQAEEFVKTQQAAETKRVQVLTRLGVPPEVPVPAPVSADITPVEQLKSVLKDWKAKLNDPTLDPSTKSDVQYYVDQLSKRLKQDQYAVDWTDNPEEVANKLEAGYKSAPTFPEVLEKALPAPEVKKFNEAIHAARQDNLEEINATLEHEKTQVVNIEKEQALDDQREAEFERIANDPNIDVVERFKRYVVADKNGKNIKSQYAIDPASLPDDLLKYVDTPGFDAKKVLVHPEKPAGTERSSADYVIPQSNTLVTPQARARLKQLGVFQKGGITAQDAANLMGVDTAENLLKILSSTPDRATIAEARADFYKEQIKKAVEANAGIDQSNRARALNNKSILSLREAKFMREQHWTETKGAIKRIALPLPAIKELQDNARAIINKTKVGDLNVQQYKVGARRSLKKSVVSVLNVIGKADQLEGGTQAFVAKVAEAQNIQLQRETESGIAKSNRNFAFLKRLKDPSVIQELKDAGPIYENALNEILDLWQLDRSKEGVSEQGSFRKYAKEQARIGNTGIFIPPEFLSDARVSANELTVEQLDTITNVLRDLVYNAKWKNRLFKHFKAKEEFDHLETVAANIHDLLSQHPDYDPRRIPLVQRRVPPGKAIRSALATAESLFTNFEHTVLALDREMLGGKMHEVFVKPLKGDGIYDKKAGDSGVHHDLVAFSEHWEKQIQKYGKKDYANLDNTWLNVPEFEKFERLNQGKMTKADLVMALAHRGDPDGIENLKKLGPDIATWDKVFDRLLSVRDGDLAQAKVDAIGSYFERSKALQKRRAGQDVKPIEGVSFTHKGVTRAGGYYPQEYVHDFNGAAIKHQLQAAKVKAAAIFGGKEAEEFARQFAAEMTDQGRYIQRVGSDKPLDLSISGFARRIEEIVSDLNYGEVGPNILKMLRHAGIKKDIISVVGVKKYGVMVNTTIAAMNRATIENRNYFADQNRFMKAIIDVPSAGQSVALLAFSMSSMFVQPVSLFTAMQRMGTVMGPKHVLITLGQITKNLSSVHGFIDFAGEIDPTIKDHMANIEDSVAASIHNLMPSANVHPSLGPMRRAQEMINNAGMMGMSKLDEAIKVITALSAYRQFAEGDVEGFTKERIAKMSDEEIHMRSIDYARQISRTSLTHSKLTDKAPFQNLPVIGKLFARFWNDQRNEINLALSVGRKFKNSVKEVASGLSEGDSVKTRRGVKGAAALVGTMMLYGTIKKLFEDRVRGKEGWGNPWDRNFDFNSVTGLKDAAAYTTKYMLMAPGELAFEALPIWRTIKYAADKPDHRLNPDIKTAQEPFVKIESDMATTFNAISDMLVLDQHPGLNADQFKAALYTLSYVTGGFPVAGPYKFAGYLDAIKDWKSKRQFQLNAGTIEMLKGEIGHYEAAPPPGVSDDFMEQLKELSDIKLTPKDSRNDIPKGSDQINKHADNGGDFRNPAFSESKWNDLMASAPELGLTENGRTAKDQSQVDKALKYENEHNARSLGDKNIPVNAETLYGAHKLGADKYAELHAKPANEKAKSALGPEHLKNNPDLAGLKTVGQVKSQFKAKVDQGRKSYENLTLQTSNNED